MATGPAVSPPKPLEDPLAHLPCSSIVEYRKGQIVYDQDQPSTSIYLVIDGKIKISRLADDGHQVDAGGRLVLVVDDLPFPVFHNARARRVGQWIFQWLRG